MTTLFLTTALFNQVARLLPDAFSPLSHLLFGGEACDVLAVRRVLEAGPPRRLLHVYGPTETTTYASWHLVHHVQAHSSTVPIGRPISNTSAYVLDERLHLVPPGVPGELYLGGDGVARGYLSRPELTADKFLPNPFSSSPGERLYRTGDKVRWRPEGSIEFLGRFDAQVKLRGFRIELGEVESALLSQPSVRQAVVIVREDSPGNKLLVAYVTGPQAEPSSLRNLLRQQLPEYMLPSAVVVLDSLPLNPNGKVETKALPPPLFDAEHSSYVAPSNDVEHQLASIWSEVLGVARLGVHDDFFSLGGHSLMATQVASRIRSSFGVELPLRTLFEAPTVAALAVHLLQHTAQVSSDELEQMMKALEQMSDDEAQSLLSLPQTDSNENDSHE